MKLKLQLFLTALLIISVTNAIGQISFDSQEDLEKAANEAFDAKKYEKAKPLFSQLLSLNALDPNYNYRFGVCILFTEADPLKPLPYIEGGASTEGVNSEAYYFLGKAYQLNYRFDDAIAYYEKAKKSGFGANGVDLDRSMEECRNGKILYNAAIEFDPAQDKNVIEAEFYRPYDFRKLKGKVIPMPPNFKTKYDQKNLKGTFVYTPSNSQVLFFASYGEDGVNAKDLYRVNRLPNGEWALPQRLPDVINTKYDEDYAFYDDESNMLYFASKGHNTMGGFDVFRSVYDAEKNEWSRPVNLQFPINSPYDDFLYVSDPDGKVAFFTSKRETEIGKIRVFKTLLHDPSKVELSIVEGTYEDKTDSIYNYMLASVFDPKTNQVIGKYRSNKETGKYVLILPPQNDYTMDVGPREAAGFRFDLDVPQHDPTQPLKQDLVYDTRSDQGTVTMTNYFDATGEPDSVAVAVNRPKEEVEMAMVEMPDREQVLAAREAERQKTLAEKEARLAELAAAENARFEKEKARQDSLIAAKRAAFEAEAARLREETVRKDSIARAEALALKEAQEKARQDSMMQVERLAQEQEKQRVIADSIIRVRKLALQMAKERETAMADSIAEAEELALMKAAEREQEMVDSIARAEEMARQITTDREKAIADSMAQAEELAVKAEEEVARRERATQDSLLAVAEQAQADSLAAVEAEKERLAQIEREVEEAKARALRDSTVERDVAAAETEDASYDDILKEMQEKEAELLAQKEAEEIRTEQTEIAELTTKDSLESTEVVSEADLFLQTIAQLEEQKKRQEQEVAAENARAEAAKKEKAEAEVVSTGKDTVAVGTEGVISDVADATQADSTNGATAPVKVDGEPDLEVESLALKSDADPNEYLATLAEIEAEMEKDNAENAKSYKLQDLAAKPKGSDEEADPELQKILDADRKALEEHQRIAVEKEAALHEQMQRDREVLEQVARDADENELEDIEAEMLEGLEVQKAAEEQPSAEEVELMEEAEETMEAPKQEPEKAVAESEPMVVEKPEEQTVEVEQMAEIEEEEAPTEAVSEMAEEELAEEERLVAEADEVIAEILQEEGNEEEVPEAPATVGLKAAVEETEVAVAEEEPIGVAKEDIAIEEVAEIEVNEPEPSEEMEQEAPIEEEMAEAVETVEAESIVNHVAESEKQAEVVTMADAAVGRIPFMEPALRDYSKRKPDFSKVQDKEVKRMVQRMRSEDIGRLAVLKNMKNQWVDAGKTKQSLKEIKDNVRNQDVLASVTERPAREEHIRQPFNKNDLRERQNVYYKLDLKLVSTAVSETVAESMTPEQSMTFFMPEFQVSTGHFTTLADARAEQRYYQGRGFDDVRIVAYHNRVPITLSDVENVPFVD